MYSENPEFLDRTGEPAYSMVRSGMCGKVWRPFAPFRSVGCRTEAIYQPRDGNVLSTLAVTGNDFAVVFWQHARRFTKHESRNCFIRFAMTNPSDGYEWSNTHFSDFFGALIQNVR